MADNYFRLVCFIVNICPEILRAFFIQLATRNAGSSYTSLNAYLTKRKQEIEQLHQRNIIWDDQKNLIFPSHGTCNEADWDVTLLVTLITKLFPRPDWSHLESKMDDIRNTRNIIQHISSTANISDTDFKTHWGRLESAAKAFAQQVFSVTEQASFETKIDELKKNFFPNLVESLRLWCEQTAKHNNDLQKEINDLKSETRHTNSILHNVTVKRPGPAGDGDKTKRFKTVDTILRGLQANFDQTIRTLPEDFSATAETIEIQTRLRDKHYVVVAGSYNSRYYETALAAIKEMNYNNEKCVVMQESSDWRHIDPEDVDFVLCMHPFGRITFDEIRAKGMASHFNSMKHTVEDQSRKSLDILIVTDIKILAECKRRYDHDILDDEVRVFEATTEEKPADLTGLACENVPVINSTYSQEFCTLRVLTDSFLRRHKDDSCSVDSHVLKEARDKFKSKKAIVLTGTINSERAAAAVALTSSYESSRCLLLTEPNDIKYISWQNTCLVIIEEFAGKYRYEENEVYKWYNMFDHLYSAVKAGKINIVITCEKNKLRRCLEEISSHPLLEHVVEMPDRVTIIKEEANDQKGSLADIRDSFTSSGQSGARANTGITESSTSSFVWHVTNEKTYSIKINDDLEECRFFDFCCLPSGEIFVADNAKHKFMKLDTNYKVVDVCDIEHYPEAVCYIGNNKVAVSLDKTLHVVNVVTMRLTKPVYAGDHCQKMASHGNLLYVLYDSTIFVYDNNGFRKRVLYSQVMQVLYDIAVSDDGSKIYITSLNGLITIDNSGNHLYTLTEIDTAHSCICVDNAGHVLVYDNESESILQVSSDGGHILGVIRELSRYILQAMCFDTRRSALLLCEKCRDHLTVLNMTKQLLD